MKRGLNVQVTLRIPSDLKTKIQRIADELVTTPAQFIRSVLVREVRDRKHS